MDQDHPASPLAARSNHSCVWDLKKNHAIIFGGGLVNDAITNEMWTWNGKVFTQLKPTVLPARRAGHSMSYDLISGKAMMFSGWNGGSYLSETWEWDGKAWTNKKPTTAPPPRDWHTMTHIVGKGTPMFGGHDWRRHSNGPGAYGDTWMWNGTTWTQLKPKTDPGKRFGHVMAMDLSRGRVVMLGGATPGKSYNDMWEWTGTDWREIKPATLPGARSFASMDWDSTRGRLVLHGGKSGSTTLTDTWEWDGVNWSLRKPAANPAVAFAKIIYDRSLKQCVLIGGAISGNRKTPSKETWAYASAKSALYKTFGTGCRGKAGVPTMSGTYPWATETMTVTTTNLPAGPAFILLGVSKTAWGAIPLPYNMAVMGAAGCVLYTDPLFQFTMSGTNGTATWAARVPNIKSAMGVSFYNQVWASDSTANGAGLVVSNAAEAKAGIR